MNGKIRVVKNIGEESKITFGAVGEELEVVDGTIEDKDGFVWDNDSTSYKSIEDINKHFAYEDIFCTEFELVEVQP